MESLCGESEFCFRRVFFVIVIDVFRCCADVVRMLCFQEFAQARLKCQGTRVLSK